MRRYPFIVVFLVIIIVIAGCGGGGGGRSGGSATWTGTVVDQNGMEVAGAMVRIGTSSATTNTSGQFSISGLIAGSNQIIVTGGTSGHFVVNTLVVVPSGGGSLGTFTAYKILGIGIIEQSPYVDSSGLGMRGIPRRKIPRVKVDFKRIMTRSALRSMRMQALSAGDFDNLSIDYVQLAWEPITVATHYKVWYLGASPISGGFTPVEIWDSQNIPSSDPSFDSLNPQAYLDRTDELSPGGLPLVTSHGYYGFRIDYYDGSSWISLPAIIVSWGMYMDGYPVLAAYERGASLSWTNPDNVSGLKVCISNDSDPELSSPIWNSGATLLSSSTTSITIPEVLTLGSYYYWAVAAYAMDETGYIAEINQGVSGFVR